MVRLKKSQKRAFAMSRGNTDTLRLKKEWEKELMKLDKVSEYSNPRGKCRTIEQNNDIVCGFRLALATNLDQVGKSMDTMNIQDLNWAAIDRQVASAYSCRLSYTSQIRKEFMKSKAVLVWESETRGAGSSVLSTNQMRICLRSKLTHSACMLITRMPKAAQSPTGASGTGSSTSIRSIWPIRP
jgi:hypothetical protein